MVHASTPDVGENEPAQNSAFMARPDTSADLNLPVYLMVPRAATNGIWYWP